MELVVHGKWIKSDDGKYRLRMEPYDLGDGMELIAQTPRITESSMLKDAAETVSNYYGNYPNMTPETALDQVKSREIPHLVEYLNAGNTDGSIGIIRNKKKGTLLLATSTPQLDSLDPETKRKIIKAPGKAGMSDKDKKELWNI